MFGFLTEFAFGQAGKAGHSQAQFLVGFLTWPAGHVGVGEQMQAQLTGSVANGAAQAAFGGQAQLQFSSFTDSGFVHKT